jgi:hypothetical protein
LSEVDKGRWSGLVGASSVTVSKQRNNVIVEGEIEIEKNVQNSRDKHEPMELNGSLKRKKELSCFKNYNLPSILASIFSTYLTYRCPTFVLLAQQ